ncbi:hypothetical protein DdX_17181 [Ditylenchus destructor]|uniref:Uncharacterized protein n=1 Tax=Ditylenchus destructor TaxID=166010 RepID=A0AAD4MP28_9BILA|nr:hypothetical protein DdX_17181 [Ditylenchus destructor]
MGSMARKKRREKEQLMGLSGKAVRVGGGLRAVSSTDSVLIEPVSGQQFNPEESADAHPVVVGHQVKAACEDLKLTPSITAAAILENKANCLIQTSPAQILRAHLLCLTLSLSLTQIPSLTESCSLSVGDHHWRRGRGYYLASSRQLNKTATRGSLCLIPPPISLQPLPCPGSRRRFPPWTQQVITCTHPTTLEGYFYAQIFSSYYNLLGLILYGLEPPIPPRLRAVPTWLDSIERFVQTEAKKPLPTNNN